MQWQALHAWLSGYAGAGGAAPSVFIVGDPKQSIYRFRRAEPQVFRAAQAFVVEALEGDLLSCDHTHRNAPAVMAVVNEVMAQAQAAGQYEGFRAHTTESTRGRCRSPACRRSRATRSAPSAVRSGPRSHSSWRDSLTVPRELPEEKLIALECRQAAAWIAQQIEAGVAPRRHHGAGAQARPAGRDGGRTARAAHPGAAAREDRPVRGAGSAGHRGAARRAGVARRTTCRWRGR